MRKPAGYKSDSTGTQWYKNFASLETALRAQDRLLDQGYRANVNSIGGRYRVVVSKEDPYSNPGRRTMTKAQRMAKAKRAGSARRKANAVKAFLKKMNPARKVPEAVKVTRLKGGGFTVKPVRNLGRLRRIVRRTVRRVTRRRARR